ncbi:hypothetical protein BDC45DRAFT_576728 [Circinella umbellata]|nr:hypothetical protein BDC45DRAFT_576728 [Circinella umbellata]
MDNPDFQKSNLFQNGSDSKWCQSDPDRSTKNPTVPSSLHTVASSSSPSSRRPLPPPQQDDLYQDNRRPSMIPATRPAPSPSPPSSTSTTSTTSTSTTQSHRPKKGKARAPPSNPKQYSPSPQQSNVYPSPKSQNTETRTSATSQYRNPPGPQLLQSINGIVSYHQYDPEFVLVPLKFNPKQRRVELGLFFDVAQHFVSRKIVQLEVKEEIDTTRRILANRIACQLSIILQRLPSESDRQHTIRSYIKTHIHNNFITNDSQLHTLINNYHNAMMEVKLRQGLSNATFLAEQCRFSGKVKTHLWQRHFSGKAMPHYRHCQLV